MDALAQTLGDIAALKKEARWREIETAIGRSLRRFVSVSPKEFARLTETGMLAELAKHGPTIWVPYKRIMVIALLKEAGDCAATKRPGGGYGWYLKALHLLLDALARDELWKYSRLVPEVESLVACLEGSSLPVRTRVLLMREYERQGQFGKVRCEFVAAIEKSPKNRKLLDFGTAFFERLGRESDATLVAAGLPRCEVNAVLLELAAAKSGLRIR